MPNYPTKSEHQRRFDAALGFYQLGMAQEANEELEKIPPELKTSVEVLRLRAEIYCDEAAWELLREVSAFLVNKWPGDSQHWIWLAYATRRCLSIPEAERVLQEALQSHASEPMIHYNLACYAAQTGDLESARVRLTHAISLNPTFRKMALDDPDLEPVLTDHGNPSTTA